MESVAINVQNSPSICTADQVSLVGPGDVDVIQDPDHDLRLYEDDNLNVSNLSGLPLTNGKYCQHEFRTSDSDARKMLVEQLPHHPPITLEFNDLNYIVRESPTLKYAGYRPYIAKQQKSILKGVSGYFKPGELTAIMGPSGAGKSTLMNILAGYKNHNVQGSILVNGRPRNDGQFRKISCYIMQDDVLLPHLTVIEAMRYAAELKLPRKTTKAQRELAIVKILDIIGLTECKNVRSSNISGGQRKRLAIALELINNPPIMFFDEPTSGLDSSTCFSCVALLKALAQGGRTIIATIHQPSARIFEQFDSLYLMAEGRCLYRGPVRSVVQFLGRQGLHCPPYHNPADFAIEVASGDYGDHAVSILAKATELTSDSKSSGLASDCSGSENVLEIDGLKFTSSSSPSTSEKKLPATFSVSVTNDEKNEVAIRLIPTLDLKQELNLTEQTGSLGSIDGDHRCGRFWNQFLTLFKRSFVCISRDTMLTRIRFASIALVGLLIGAIYHDAGSHASKCFNNAGNLFFGLLFLVFSAMMSTILTFPLERGVLIREHLNCWYSLKSYYFARTCADLPFQLFYPTLYVLISYFMTEQPLEFFRFGIVCGMAILVSLVAQSIGLLIGAGCAIQNAVFVGPITTIPIFLFSGFFVTLNTVPAYLRWVSWISYARFAFQSTLTAVYGYDRGNLKCSEAYCHFKNPNKFLEQLDAVDISVAEQAAYLVIILIVLRVLAYWALRLKIMAERI